MAAPQRVAIVGCGLIGCSFAMALRAAGRVTDVVGFDRDPATAMRAVALGIVDRSGTTLADTVAHADLVLIATPVAQSRPILDVIAAALPAHAVVTDVGSTKGDVVSAARAALGDAFARFVPGHPIAGRELHGPDAAKVDLFSDRRVLLTPLAETDPAAVARVSEAWRACGAVVETIEAGLHDRVLSAVSHLPHLLAYALVAQIVASPHAERCLALAGSGFRDFTRIAASSPEIWRDIALANRDALLDDLDTYRAGLDTMRTSLAAGDGDALRALFARASAARSAWSGGR